MKIGFTGAGGTGKTTVLNVIAERFPDVPILGSPIRDVYKRWGISEIDQEKMSFDEKLKLQEDIYQTRYAKEIEYGNHFISDRTILDHYCYQQIRCYDAMDQEMFDQKTSEIKENLLSYDLIFYFPITFKQSGDDVRYANPVFQNMIDNFIIASLIKMKIPNLVVPFGTPEQRADYIATQIDSIDDNI